MAYTKCVWVEKLNGMEQEATIPSSWVFAAEGVIRWPVKVNALRAMQEQRLPQENWKTFNLVKVKLADDDIRLCDAFNVTSASNESDVSDTETLSRSINNSQSTDCKNIHFQNQALPEVVPATLQAAAHNTYFQNPNTSPVIAMNSKEIDVPSKVRSEERSSGTPISSASKRNA
ncbi:uncharacterized protein LOC130648402 isoform X1 [Hydractinia symbiolongicarpus]|uniref:uncharacterized protein LOC130648402 isoform X1 n=1 Tax=Hydractinia symbiolongicarpus TaxID=13093 RepID=UPI00254DE8B7|nr:uncharacterized protein LOC130648402 isoform X1 [Hydractinia symbiolongicarpus]